MQVRLQKILSTAGIASRRAAEEFITQGRVSVNGTTVSELGSKADPETDDIRVDGRRLKMPARRRYILLYKPKGYITTRSDPERRPTVLDLLTTGGVRDYVYPVGRLDYDSEGLLLLTSDGDLAEKLTHPKHGVGREYHVRVRGVPDDKALERLRKGISLDGERTAPASVDLHKVIETERGADAILSMVIYEGRNRQVRRMCEAVGHPVSKLKRVRIGPITDDHIRPGEFRDLDEREVEALRRAVARTPRPGPRVPASALRATAGKPSPESRAATPEPRAAVASPKRVRNSSREGGSTSRRADSPRTTRGPRSHASRRNDRPRRG
jgi:23S rRNA pseudouridine2605 synthase